MFVSAMTIQLSCTSQLVIWTLPAIVNYSMGNKHRCEDKKQFDAAEKGHMQQDYLTDLSSSH